MSREEYELRKHYEQWQSYQAALQPFIKAAADAMSMSMPQILIYPDGRMETIYSEETKKTMAAWSDVMIQLAQSYGFHVCPLPTPKP